MRLNRKYIKGLYKYLRKRLSYIYARFKNRFIHDSVKNPHRLILVNPADIQERQVNCAQTDLNIFEKVKKDALHLYDLDLGAFDQRRNTGRIMDGDWDMHKKTYAGEPLYVSYNQRFNEGKKWEETPYYQKGIGTIKNGGIMYGCRTVEEFEAKRLGYIEKLYQDIKDNGYATQDKTAEDARSKGIHHEVSVNIGRNGELIYNNSTGNNRLALSKVLKLDKIPVLVVVRHKQWELLKEHVRQNGLSDIDKPLAESVRNHPDFQA